MPKTINRKRLNEAKSNKQQSETNYIAQSEAMCQIIRNGEEEIARGGGKKVNIHELWEYDTKI